MSWRVASPAKVNLFLRVLGRRADGYHQLETCLHALTLADELQVERGGNGVSLTVDDRTGRGLPVTVGPDNLVCRAAESFCAATGKPPDLRFHLRKHIPAGSGMGGGSSNAAAALRLLDHLFETPLEPGELHDLAARLGADVPFFLRCGTQVATGVGDRLEPVTPGPVLHFVLLLPPFGVSTAAVYAQSGARCLTDSATVPSMQPPSARWRWEEVSIPERFVNDLERAAMTVEPRLGDLYERVLARGYRHLRMSGSGSTLFLAWPRAEQAIAAAADLSDLVDEGVEVVRTMSAHDRAGPIEPLIDSKGDGC